MLKAEIFTLTDEHLKLLRAMCIGWQDCEYGAPEVDPKRPYGNSSVEPDIHEILTGETDYELTDAQRGRYAALHRETEKALQIVLSTGEFEPGRFRREPYSSKWARISE